MLRLILLLSVLWPAILADHPQPALPLPVSAYFQDNATTLVQTGPYHRAVSRLAECRYRETPDPKEACTGRDGLVVWRRGVRLQPGHRGFRT